MTAAIRERWRTRRPGGGADVLFRAVATHAGDVGDVGD